MTNLGALFSSHGTSRDLTPGQHAFRQGDRFGVLFYVRTGFLKAYYTRSDGKEHIKSFHSEGSIISSMVALTQQEPSTFSLVAIEPTQLVSLPFETLETLSQSDLEFSNALVQFLIAYGRRKERREYELLCRSPEERLGLILADEPELAERVSQADLAAYIGVTPQALSRIKRRQRD